MTTRTFRQKKTDTLMPFVLVERCCQPDGIAITADVFAQPVTEPSPQRKNAVAVLIHLHLELYQTFYLHALFFLLILSFYILKGPRITYM